jgi:hypothetical protein
MLVECVEMVPLQRVEAPFTSTSEPNITCDQASLKLPTLRYNIAMITQLIQTLQNPNFTTTHTRSPPPILQ